MVYDSVYEANNYLRGTARKQHFWDWFSGSQLPTYSAPATTSNISWDSSTDVNVSISGNTVTATGGTAWDKFAQSTQTFTPSDSPTLEYTSNASYYNMTGFGKGAASQNGNYYGSLSFGIYSMSGSIAIYENAAQVHVGGSHSSTDVLKVTMDSNGLVKYYSGSTLIYTSTQTASGSYDVRFAGYHTNASVTATATASSSLGYDWTTTTGGASIEMNDEADGGLKLYTTSTGTNSNFTMNFDNKRQYAHDGSVCIFTVNADVQQASTTNWFLQVGLGHTVGNTGHWLSAKSAQSYLRLQTSQSESATYSADTTVSNSPDWVTAKIENKSSSCDLSLNGTVAVTNSSGLQTSTGMQPVVYGNRGTSGSAGSNPLVCKLRYFEAYNT